MSDKERIHIVKWRENLSVIAEKYYGRKKGTHWKQIYAANKQVIGPNPNRIKPGMKLKIPVLGSRLKPPENPDVIYTHTTTGEESLRDLAHYYYGDADDHPQISRYSKNKPVLDAFDSKSDSKLPPGKQIFILNPQPQTAQDVPLLYDVDRIAIWLNRLGILVGGMDAAFNEVAQISSEFDADKAPPTDVQD